MKSLEPASDEQDILDCVSSSVLAVPKHILQKMSVVSDGCEGSLCATDVLQETSCFGSCVADLQNILLHSCWCYCAPSYNAPACLE